MHSHVREMVKDRQKFETATAGLTSSNPDVLCIEPA